MSLYKLMLNTDLRDLIDEIEEAKENNLNLYEREEEGTEAKAYFYGIDSGYKRAIQIIEGRLRI